MAEPIDNYIPQNIVRQFRKQALRVWGVAAGVVFLWVALVVAAPLLAAAGYIQISSPIYKFFSFICHQMDDRSFHLESHALAVCSRCFGVYFGLLAGILIYPLWRSIDEIEPIARFWLFFSIIPIGIDWSLTIFGIWENTYLSRFITGMILGVACATFIVPALVEIKRNYSFKKINLDSGV